MPRFLYFAYGSNLLAERLAVRCPGAKPVGLAYVSGWRLAFQSKSFDGSGKATLIHGGGDDVVHGRLYEIPVGERDTLDKAEGADRDPPVYRRHDDFTVTTVDGVVVADVSVYLAREETPPLAPWDWYRALIVAGGMQAELPAAEVAALAVTPALPDPLPNRRARREALAILEAAGFLGLAEACGAAPATAANDTPKPAVAVLDTIAEQAVAEAVSGG
ncbi:MAG: gamma-glutamylcyclotransferase [Siculibacillus sp.]|nr:gamma-glutamylcyclotransferase [Siculibacillus sp.]